jgi:hypothetical protein
MTSAADDNELKQFNFQPSNLEDIDFLENADTDSTPAFWKGVNSGGYDVNCYTSKTFTVTNDAADKYRQVLEFKDINNGIFGLYYRRP